MRGIYVVIFLMVVVLLNSCDNSSTGPVEPAEGWAVIKIDPVPSNGSIRFNPEGVRAGNEYRFEPGILVKATAVPSEGSEFKSWTGDVGLLTSTEIEINTTSDSAIHLSATFNKVPMGISWTKQESGVTSGLVSVTGGKGLIVVVGNNGTILTSTDGVSWTKRSTGLNTCLNHVIWTGSKFVVVGDSGAILISADGVSWSVKNGPEAYHLESVVWNGKMLVATGGHMINSGLTDNTVLTSSDGEVWTDQFGGTGIWYTAAWSGYAFVAGGYNYNYSTVSDNSSYSLYMSIDGKDWTHLGRGVDLYTSFNSIIFHNDRFIGVGGSRRTGDPFTSLYYSDNVDYWESMSSPTNSSLNSVAWSGTNYVAVGDDGIIITNDTSLGFWTKQASGVDIDLYEVACTGSKMVAVGYGGTILTSNCQCDALVTDDDDSLTDTWKLLRTTMVYPDGSKETFESDSANTRTFIFKSDNKLIISVQSSGMEPQLMFGTWSTQGETLSVFIYDENGEASPAGQMVYNVNGNTLTWSINVTQGGVSIKLTEVYQRDE